VYTQGLHDLDTFTWHVLKPSFSGAALMYNVVDNVFFGGFGIDLKHNPEGYGCTSWLAWASEYKTIAVLVGSKSVRNRTRLKR